MKRCASVAATRSGRLGQITHRGGNCDRDKAAHACGMRATTLTVPEGARGDARTPAQNPRDAANDESPPAAALSGEARQFTPTRRRVHRRSQDHLDLRGGALGRGELVGDPLPHGLGDRAELLGDGAAAAAPDAHAVTADVARNTGLAAQVVAQAGVRAEAAAPERDAVGPAGPLLVDGGGEEARERAQAAAVEVHAAHDGVLGVARGAAARLALPQLVELATLVAPVHLVHAEGLAGATGRDFLLQAVDRRDRLAVVDEGLVRHRVRVVGVSSQ
eukprot:CAMPEP_0174827710 /NCGR_PEP_ID=MMETSP1114-20130205/889_1 /TAXON_ID=312471 /ORGANISM="Neobodo designis, Strain CCAP 1951/1" /LENGTH=274 /DNA_ID=CAMNT_0016061385 /DNA_START=121 /DNA_END=946 /DNA_ORIENTATION=+